MTSATRTRERRTPTEPEPGLREVGRRVNRLLISKHTGLALILAMAFLTLLGTLLEQAPDGALADPAAYDRWLETVRPRYGGWTTPLSAAGMFHVFSSVWFQGVSVLLAVSIIACTAHRAPQLWQRARHPHTHATDGFLQHAGQRAEVVTDDPPQQARARVEAALRRHRYRVVVDDRDPERGLYADRFRYLPFGTVFAHAAFVIIIAGVLISATTGFTINRFPVAVGSRADVGHGTGLSVEARSFADRYDADGRPADYVSDLVVYDEGREVARQDVRVNTPLRYGGVSFHQSYFGIAAVLQVKDAHGTVLFDGSVPLEFSSDDERHSIGTVTLAGQGLTVYAITAASGRPDATVAAGQLQIDVYRTGEQEPFESKTVAQGQSATLGGLTYTFQRERQFTGLMVGRDPGKVWVWAGSGLMMLGLIATLFFRHRRLWVRVEAHGSGSRVRIASAERHDSLYQAWFTRFAHELAAPSAARPDSTPSR